MRGDKRSKETIAAAEAAGEKQLMRLRMEVRNERKDLKEYLRELEWQW